MLLKREKNFYLIFSLFDIILELGKKYEIFHNNFSNLFLLFLEKTQKLFFEEKEKKLFFKKNISSFFIEISKLFSRSGNSALFKRVVIYQLNF